MSHSTVDVRLLDRALDGIAQEMVAFRRDIHAHPELAWNEVRTSAAVAEQLRQSGVGVTARPGGTGLICDVLGDSKGPRVALRADLDALPIDDKKDVAYRSCTPGVAHACGHDVHTAVVLGVGMGLARLAATGDLPGRVRLLFQPAEEVMPGGALSMLQSGALDGVQRVFALHCDPRVDAGSVAVREGPMTGATDLVTVRLSGPGGHTARPQLTVDVVAALADVVVRTPAILSRRVDPRAGMSLVWGTISAGSAANVIPQSGAAAGSVRTLDRVAWKAAEQLVPQIIREVATPYQAHVEVEYLQGVPPAVNDGAATAAFRSAANAVLGPEGVQETQQSMGAEDFAWMLDRVPGVLARLGVRRPGTIDAPDLHRGDFDIDESAISCGTRVLMAATLDALRSIYPVTPEELANLAHLRRARDLMDREYASPLDVAALARAALMSSAHFSRQFRAAYGETPYAYLMTRRIERAKALLRGGNLSVTEVCLAVGFTSLGSFSARFTDLVGETPTAYRARDHSALASVPGCSARDITRPRRRPSRMGEAHPALARWP